MYCSIHICCCLIWAAISFYLAATRAPASDLQEEGHSVLRPVLACFGRPAQTAPEERHP